LTLVQTGSLLQLGVLHEPRELGLVLIDAPAVGVALDDGSACRPPLVVLARELRTLVQICGQGRRRGFLASATRQ
ncbi:hypothetical protein PMAYCL1PPCAC_11405, partial [Pristionchus mayeri]